MRDLSEAEFMLKKLGVNHQREVAQIIRDHDGSYTFAIIDKTRVIVGRDPLGTCPLYYGEIKTLWAAASEQKALWKIGFKNVKPFPPGNLATVTMQNSVFQLIKTVSKTEEKKCGIETATEILQRLLWNAVEKRITDLKEVAVAFSGGIDSSLIAFVVQHIGLKVHLFTVGLKGQEELKHAKGFANLLELPIHIQTYKIDDVESQLPAILWLIEKIGILDAGIAVPLYWTAENASKMGFKVMLAGQGSDELFGGYQKYLKIYEHYGEEKLGEMLFQDVVNSYETNYQRDNKVSAFHKIELRLPFTDLELINFALSMPLGLKIQPEKGIRKIILRHVAKKLGLPASIVDRPKKAIQYTTGVDKALKKLAKGEKLNLQNYLMKHFRDSYSPSKVENM